MNPKLKYCAMAWLAFGFALLPVGVLIGYIDLPMGYAVCGPLVVMLAALAWAWRVCRGYNPDDPYADREEV
jgi:hypothetical protein